MVEFKSIEQVKKTQKIVGIVLVVCVILLFFLGYKMLQKNSECSTNPFQYGAQKSSDSGFPLRCRCDSKDMTFESFYFDEEGFMIKDEVYP